MGAGSACLGVFVPWWLIFPRAICGKSTTYVKRPTPTREQTFPSPGGEGQGEGERKLSHSQPSISPRLLSSFCLLPSALLCGCRPRLLSKNKQKNIKRRYRPISSVTVRIRPSALRNSQFFVPLLPKKNRTRDKAGRSGTTRDHPGHIRDATGNFCRLALGSADHCSAPEATWLLRANP
jgi:hypothetical protein